MNTHTDKSQDHSRRSAANALSEQQRGEASAFQAIDQRPEARTQRQLQAITRNSPRLLQLQAIQEIADRDGGVLPLKINENAAVATHKEPAIQRKVLVNGSAYAPETNEKASPAMEAAMDDEFLRYYESKQEALDHIDKKAPGKVGLIESRALWYRIPYLNQQFFVFGESHAAVKGSQVKAASNLTKPILDEALSGWEVEEMNQDDLDDNQDTGLDEHSSKLMRALEMWRAQLHQAPAAGRQAETDLPEIPRGAASTREKESGTYRLVVPGQSGAEEYWKPSGATEAPPNTYDSQAQMLAAIEGLFREVFAKEIRNLELDELPGGMNLYHAWEHFQKKSWAGHAKETTIKQNVAAYLYQAAKHRAEEQYQKLDAKFAADTRNGDRSNWRANDYRDEYMFLRILEAKDGEFAFANMGNAHLKRLKDRFAARNIPFILMEDFYDRYAVDAVDTQSIAYENSPVFRKNQRLVLWLKAAFRVYPNLQQMHLDELDDYDMGEFILTGKVSKWEREEVDAAESDHHKPVLFQFLRDLKKTYPNSNDFVQDLTLEEFGEFLTTEKIARWENM